MGYLSVDKVGRFNGLPGNFFADAECSTNRRSLFRLIYRRPRIYAISLWEYFFTSRGSARINPKNKESHGKAKLFQCSIFQRTKKLSPLVSRPGSEVSCFSSPLPLFPLLRGSIIDRAKYQFSPVRKNETKKKKEMEKERSIVFTRRELSTNVFYYRTCCTVINKFSRVNSLLHRINIPWYLEFIDLTRVTGEFIRTKYLPLICFIELRFLSYRLIKTKKRFRGRSSVSWQGWLATMAAAVVIHCLSHSRSPKEGLNWILRRNWTTDFFLSCKTLDRFVSNKFQLVARLNNLQLQIRRTEKRECKLSTTINFSMVFLGVWDCEILNLSVEASLIKFFNRIARRTKKSWKMLRSRDFIRACTRIRVYYCNRLWKLSNYPKVSFVLLMDNNNARKYFVF